MTSAFGIPSAVESQRKGKRSLIGIDLVVDVSLELEGWTDQWWDTRKFNGTNNRRGGQFFSTRAADRIGLRMRKQTLWRGKFNWRPSFLCSVTASGMDGMFGLTCPHQWACSFCLFGVAKLTMGFFSLVDAPHFYVFFISNEDLRSSDTGELSAKVSACYPSTLAWSRRLESSGIKRLYECQWMRRWLKTRYHS